MTIAPSRRLAVFECWVSMREMYAAPIVFEKLLNPIIKIPRARK